MDPHTWPCQSRTTGTNIHSAAMWGCCPEDLPRAMKDREEWRERVRDIHATSATWWWWWWWWRCSKLFIYFFKYWINLLAKTIPYRYFYLIVKEIIKMDLKAMCFFFLNNKISDIWIHAIKRIDFIPTKFSRLSMFFIQKQVNLSETLMIKLISCPCNLQYIKTKLQQIKPSKIVKR